MEARFPAKRWTNIESCSQQTFVFCNKVLQIRSDYSFVLMLNPTHAEHCLSKNVDALAKTCIATSEICFVPNADK